MPAGNKLINALIFQGLDDVVVVDTNVAEAVKGVLSLLDVEFVERSGGWVAVVLVCLDGVQGHRVDRVGDDQAFDIEEIGVAGIPSLR